MKNNYKCWVARHYSSVKIILHDQVARKICTQKYRDAWVGAFKWGMKIALQAEVAHLLERRVN